MTEKEIIQALKTNTRQFKDLSAEEQAWARAHWADMMWQSETDGWWRIKQDGNFCVKDVYRFRPDYPDPAEPPTMPANTEHLADQAVRLNQAKNNLYPLWHLRKHDPDLAKLIESVPANEVVYRDESGAWFRSGSGAVINNWLYRVHKDWQPKPEAIPEPPVIPGYRLAMIEKRNGIWQFRSGGGHMDLFWATTDGACGYLVWNPVEKRWVQWYLTFAYVMPWGMMSPTGGVGDTLVYASYVMFPEAQ